MKLNDAIDDFLLNCEVEAKTAKTMRSYHDILYNYMQIIGNIEVETMTPTHIRQYMASEMKRTIPGDRNLSSYSLFKYYSVVRIFVRWLFKQKMITTCPTDYTRAPKMDNDLPDALTKEEVTRLFKYLEDHRTYRDKVLFEFFLDTGCRLAEVVGLNLEDVHIKEGWVKVFGKGHKQGIVPIGMQLAKDLNTYILRYRKPKDPDEKALFLNHMDERLGYEGLSILVRRVLSDVGVDGKKGPHKLRHTFATNYLRNHGDLESLRRIMRHNNIKTTTRYTNLVMEDVLSAHRSASPLDNLMKKH